MTGLVTGEEDFESQIEEVQKTIAIFAYKH